ncbi:ubiquitin carboxyl-terminal hydrolase puf-like, partial [Pollicipes pollicipes]|uniref:ubiquitin carboxyl-terminal hydrolase puf-like n=1 Tax=Pollicipes pollicipes TaxID=41117 RepID=UPI001884F3C9
MELEAVAARLTSVLYDASLPRDPNHYKTGFWGRAQVVHYAMSLLVSLCFSAPEAADALYRCQRYPEWLRRLLLDDPEPETRRELAAGLDRLCLGHADGGQTGDQFVVPVLSELLKFIPSAASMRPSNMEFVSGGGDEPAKEPYGPSCREYFGLTCRLLESLDEADAAELRLVQLAEQCARSVRERDLLERRHQTAPDDGLVGLLKLSAALARQAAAFKASPAATELVHQLFDALFALPTPKERLLPCCKSVHSRSACYDLLVELTGGCEPSFDALLGRLLEQTAPSRQSPYPWDYWPHEDGRSDCGYVGLTNLGATCYMASCMQHLYMMPQARASILQAPVDNKCEHGMTLRELQRMFAYLMESERKAYNPRSFCKVYTMDHRPLNTGEQKDMAEFFIDLVSKLEEMTPELKRLVKQLFCGQITNNVVSLDCAHVSRTCEEFYTVRCQVADMRNLYESLDEVTVKDTLDGDNMYTCSQCQKKVRAEKRACFKRLPHILCFNTMRYTFNMNTMMREKVNTLFSFPLHLDMSGYRERNLMPTKCEDGEADAELAPCQYDLIGVTVHTGTADGGHYYSFIRDRTSASRNSWLFFNDAEVKPFDPSQLAGECFGGEMTSKTYDSITDKFLDFSFEKTNSAYMLFYERCVEAPEQGGSKPVTADAADLARPHLSPLDLPTFELSAELEDWIWKDNMEFLRDKSMFDHTFFNFMWQVCGYIPQTLSRTEAVTLRAARLSTTFFLEIFIHAKEKPTMVQWVELLTKQFNASQAACEWFLDHMATDEWWPIQILIKCPNQMVRQMFQRLCIHVVQKLRPVHSCRYLQPAEGEARPRELGQSSCVTRFVRKLVSLMEHGAKSHLRNLTEYFAFLFEFGKMGDTEIKFLLATECITTMVNFYLSQIPENQADEVSDEDDEEGEAGPVRPADKFRPASLEKMISLVALLVEKSRADDQRLALSASDLAAVAGGKGFPFLYHQIKDGLNVRATCGLVSALCRWNERLAVLVVGMIFQAVIKHQEACQPFFRLLSLLVEGDGAGGGAAGAGGTGTGGTGGTGGGGGGGLPCFTQLALQHIWEVAEFCPQAVLEWLAGQVPRNKLAHSWVLQNLDNWCEHFLLAHGQFRVRASASLLLVGLVPSSQFRHLFTQRQRQSSAELPLAADALAVLHQVYRCLLRLLKPARVYTDVQLHGNMKLVQYFQLMQHCVVSRAEKLMFSPYTADLWTLFHPKLSEPSIAAHHNKQALLMFWCTVCIDCAENVQLIVTNPHITKNIGFNYILADHDDDQVVLFNRSTLPAYYGLLRLCCSQSRAFTRQLANHQNLQWAFKNITPYPAQYSAAMDELLKLMSLFVMVHPDTTEQELREIGAFKRQTLQMYLQVLDARSSWATLISALKILVDTQEDRLFVVYNGGVSLLCEATLALHVMFHEATACHVTGEMTDLVRLLADTLRCCKTFRDNKDVRHALLNCKERQEVVRKLATLLNSFAPPELRLACIDALKEFVVVLPHESLQVLTPLMLHSHTALREAAD